MAAPNLTFLNNNPPQCGADSLNAFTQEINNLITGMGITASESVYDQAIKAMLKAAATGTVYTYSGTANAIILTALGGRDALTTYYPGVRAAFFATIVNTGATTVNIDGLGVKNLVLEDGSAIEAGNVNGYCEIIFDDTNDYFILTNPYEDPGVSRSAELVKMLVQNSNAVIYPEPTGSYANTSGSYTSPTAATHLVVNTADGLKIVEVQDGPATGTITALDVTTYPMTATIGGTAYNLLRIDLSYLRHSNAFLDGVIQAAELTNTGALFNDGTPSYRAQSVTYTNDRDYPLPVIISCGGGSVNTLFYIDGVIWSNEEGSPGSHFAIIPIGSTYMTSGGTLQYWREVRIA